MIQETKKEKIDNKMVGSIWGTRFKEWAFLPSIGRSGGILMIWDVRSVRGVEVLQGGYSLSVLLNSLDGGSSWWCTGVYGPCDYKERKYFWEELGVLSGFCGDKWLIGGDFNVVRYPSEKLNEDRFTSMRKFDAFVKDTELRDIPLLNADYTWSNLRARLACARLDRFLFTEGWEDMFKSVRQ